MTLAIIGGSGFGEFENQAITEKRKMNTPFGAPSSELIVLEIAGKQVVFLPRHGNPHTLPPHKINYRANIHALKQLEATDIIAVAAVGGITPKMKPAHLCIPDQVIDYSYGREHTFFADNLQQVTHIDFTWPYTPLLRNALLEAATVSGVEVEKQGVYGCTQGPRLESAAEIQRMERDGCDIVGMTGMPEAALARELDINYAAINVVVNWAAGKSAGEITMEEILSNMEKGMLKVSRVLKRITG